MAVYSTADTTYALIVETTAGVVPATPAFIQFNYNPGTMPNEKFDTAVSNARNAYRGANGVRNINFSVGGGHKMDLRRDPAIELLLQSALSGVWTSNVLTAGNTETNLTIEERNTDGTNKLFRRFSGIQVSGFSFDSALGSSIIEASFDYVGMNMTRDTAIVTSATYAAPNATNPSLTGADLTGLTITGLSGIEPAKFSFKLENDREAQGVLGSNSARGVGTSGRKISGSVTFYRKDFTPETVLNAGNLNPDIAMSFTVGTGTGNSYLFTLPAVNFERPTNDEDGGKLFATVNWTATVDPTTLTDCKITRS